MRRRWRRSSPPRSQRWARRRRLGGADVVAGLVETHGRAETQAQLGELEVLPLRRLDHRGQSLAEFDLDAALA